MYTHLPRNRGGWPAKTKTVHDARARRVSLLAQDKLDHAMGYIRSTVNGDWYDPVIKQGDRASSEAYALLFDAMVRVQRFESAAHLAAALKACTGSVSVTVRES